MRLWSRFCAICWRMCIAAVAVLCSCMKSRFYAVCWHSVHCCCCLLFANDIGVCMMIEVALLLYAGPLDLTICIGVVVACSKLAIVRVCVHFVILKLVALDSLNSSTTSLLLQASQSECLCVCCNSHHVWVNVCLSVRRDGTTTHIHCNLDDCKLTPSMTNQPLILAESFRVGKQFCVPCALCSVCNGLVACQLFLLSTDWQDACLHSAMHCDMPWLTLMHHATRAAFAILLLLPYLCSTLCFSFHQEHLLFL